MTDIKKINITRINYNPLTTISQTSGTIALEANKIYTMTINGATVFQLPSTVDTTMFNQIKLMVSIVGTPSITVGTTQFFNNTAPEFETGNWDIYYDYDPLLNAWVVGALPKGVE